MALLRLTCYPQIGRIGRRSAGAAPKTFLCRYVQARGCTMWWDKPKPNNATNVKPGAVEDPHPFPFMRIRWIGFIVTAAIFIATTVSLATQGLNMGLDFTGGVLVEAAPA